MCSQSVDVKGKALTTAAGDTITFDQLVYAAGARVRVHGSVQRRRGQGVVDVRGPSGMVQGTPCFALQRVSQGTPRCVGAKRTVQRARVMG